MEAIDFLTKHNIFLNYFSIGATIVFLFMILSGVFMLSLPHKAKSTTHMGIGFIFMALFTGGYVIAQSLYAPIGAYHRYLTVGFVTLAIVHFTQWAMRFPENTHAKLARGLLVVEWIGSLVGTAAFIYATTQTGPKYHFSAHYWDFDADKASKLVAYQIIAYIAIMVVVAVWRTIITKTKERWAIPLITFALLVASLVPSILNVQSRDGAVDRGTFILYFVLLIVSGFFLVILTYLNTTKDRSTFMVKIVGVTLVTFLIMMQFVSLFTMRDREEEFDALHIQYMFRALESRKIEPAIDYILKLDSRKNTIETVHTSSRYEGLAPDRRLEFSAGTVSMLNTRVYERILASASEPEFKDAVSNIVRDSHPQFAGYRAGIEEFIKNYKGSKLTEDLTARIDKLDQVAFINSNHISALPSDRMFRPELEKLLKSPSRDFVGFAEAIKAYLSTRGDANGLPLKREVLSFLAPMKQEHTRIYRSSANGEGHFVAFTQYEPQDDALYEIGYGYATYRQFVHPAARRLVSILLIALVILVGLYPLFFRGSLINPLNSLLRGVTKVNNGDLSVEVPVKVQDEIGFLTTSFNSMVHSIRDARARLQDYANNLEDKVKERTAELNKTLEQVHALKIQQDGDYFLTSLLAKPLFFNANKSRSVRTDFLIRQKKRFEFRNKQSELGGDICITGNLRFSYAPERRFVVSLNGDAMGKSMQGAGGSLVMGVVMNSIMARSAKNNRILTVSPDQWLKDVYEEVHSVFLAFNGSMVISVVMSIVDEATGEMWYWNAEHPFQILYRNGKASFIEEDLQLRKVGLESEIPFRVRKFQLQPNDVIFMGSDGRDDIDLTPDQPVRSINEDEFLILKRVEEADGDLEGILERLLATGELTDDLSFLRLEFKGVTDQGATSPTHQMPATQGRVIIDIDPDDEDDMNFEDVEEIGSFDELFIEGRRLARQGKHDEALEVLRQAYSMRRDVPALNKVLAVLTFKDRDYPRAVEILGNYLEHDPHVADFWLYLSIAHKRMGDYQKALDAALKVYDINPNRVPNLIHLADLYQKLGDVPRAHEILDRALRLDPENRQARSLMGVLP